MGAGDTFPPKSCKLVTISALLEKFGSKSVVMSVLEAKTGIYKNTCYLHILLLPHEAERLTVFMPVERGQVSNCNRRSFN